MMVGGKVYQSLSSIRLHLSLHLFCSPTHYITGKNVFGKEGIFPHNFVVLTDDPTIFTSVRASPIMQSSPAAFPDYMPTSASMT